MHSFRLQILISSTSKNDFKRKHCNSKKEQENVWARMTQLTESLSPKVVFFHLLSFEEVCDTTEEGTGAEV